MHKKSINIYAPASSKYYYTLSSSWEELELTDENKENNESTVDCKGTLESEGIAFSGDSEHSLSLYWYDDYKNKDGKKIKTKTITALSLDASISISDKITVKHKEDGTLNGYLKVVFTKSGTSNYVPASNNVKTKETALTAIDRDKKIRMKINNFWYEGILYVKVKGVWYKTTPYIKINGSWKICK